MAMSLGRVWLDESGMEIRVSEGTLLFLEVIETKASRLLRICPYWKGDGTLSY